jgi:ribosomal protein S18
MGSDVVGVCVVTTSMNFNPASLLYLSRTMTKAQKIGSSSITGEITILSLMVGYCVGRIDLPRASYDDTEVVPPKRRPASLLYLSRTMTKAQKIGSSSITGEILF